MAKKNLEHTRDTATLLRKKRREREREREKLPIFVRVTENSDVLPPPRPSNAQWQPTQVRIGKIRRNVNICHTHTHVQRTYHVVHHSSSCVCSSARVCMYHRKLSSLSLSLSLSSLAYQSSTRIPPLVIQMRHRRAPADVVVPPAVAATAGISERESRLIKNGSLSLFLSPPNLEQSLIFSPVRPWIRRGGKRRGGKGVFEGAAAAGFRSMQSAGLLFLMRNLP